jgi:hypothetical protein
MILFLPGGLLRKGELEVKKAISSPVDHYKKE